MECAQFRVPHIVVPSWEFRGSKSLSREYFVDSIFFFLFSFFCG